MTPAQAPAPIHRTSWWLLAVFVCVPSAILLGRAPFFPTSRWLNEAFSLSALAPAMERHAEFVFFVPLSAVVVAFFRLTLGLPVLSLFRPILTAIGFRLVGIGWGLVFLTAILGTVVLVKPVLKGANYYVRVPLLLSLTAGFLMVAMLIDQHWHFLMFKQFAHFPIICLALICEGFTRILNEKGLRAALWPTINMAAAAAVIALLAAIPGGMRFLMGFPEVLLLQGAAVVAIDRFCAFRVFENRNPFERANGGIVVPLQLAQTMERRGA